MAPKISQFASSTGGSTIVGMRRKADALAAKGMTIIDLGAGEPDFDAPAPIKDAAIKAIEDNHSHYIDPRGLLELRQKIADHAIENHGLEVDPDQIIVTPGTFGALSIVSRSIVNPGDEVLIIEPFWGPYRDVISLTGAIPVGVSMPTVQGRFEIDVDRLTAAITPKTKAILLNTPWNPTGRVLNLQEITAVAELAQQNDLWIISDEVYSKNIYDDETHISVASLGPDIAARTVIVTSFSKSYAMTGWRIGYTISNPELAEVLGRVNQYSTRGAASMVQHASITAIDVGDKYIDEMNAEYARRRDAITNGLNQIDGIRCPVPEGGMFAFAEFPAHWGDSTGVADYLLTECGVIVTPGSDFGRCSRHHLRFSFATSLETINQGITKLQDALPKKYGRGA